MRLREIKTAMRRETVLRGVDGDMSMTGIAKRVFETPMGWKVSIGPAGTPENNFGDDHMYFFLGDVERFVSEWDDPIFGYDGMG